MKLTVLRKQEYYCLVEALRRRSRFHMAGPGDTHTAITNQWTGLGSATTYKQAVQAGYMESIPKHEKNPGYHCWWRLTPKGALVVAYWIGLGFSHERIEREELPPMQIPFEVL